MTAPRALLYLLAFVAVVAVAILAYSRLTVPDPSAWQQQAEAAVAEAQAEARAREVAEAERDELRREVATLRVQSDTIAARAGRTVAALQGRVDTLRLTLPPDTIRDPIIDTLFLQVERLQAARMVDSAAIDAQERVIESLYAENAVLARRVETLTAVINDAPEGRPWYLPTLVLGYGATLDREERTVHDGPSLVLGWRIAL